MCVRVKTVPLIDDTNCVMVSDELENFLFLDHVLNSEMGRVIFYWSYT